MSKYSKIDWGFSGLESQKEAEDLLDEMITWLNVNHDKNDWTLVSSVKKTPHGWSCGFVAEKGATSA